MKSPIPVILLLLVFLGIALSGPLYADSRVFPCKNRPAKELLPKIQALLSKDGRVTVDDATNSLIVSDTSSVLADIDKLMKDLDAAPKYVTINVKSFSPTFLESIGTKVDWTTLDGNWRVGDRPGAAWGNGRYEASGKSLIVHGSADAAERMYKVRAGETAHVALGGRVRADRLKAGIFMGQPFAEDLKAAEAQAFLMVTPAVTGQNVFLTVVPAVVVYSGKGAKTHLFENLKTTARCPASGEILLGTNDANGPAILGGILSGFQGSGGASERGFSVLLKVDSQ
jgi:hypothetical protein